MNQIFIRIFSLPSDFSEDFCFGGKKIPHVFNMVDWFNIPEGITEDKLKEFLNQKSYYIKGSKLLLLGEDSYSLVIRCN